MSTYREIDVTDLLQMMSAKPVLLVDVRNDDEVARGIIPNAIHIPLATLPTQYEPLVKAKNVVFYCHSGIRSAHAAAFAAGKGCKNVYNLTGGILAWGKAEQVLVPMNERKK